MRIGDKELEMQDQITIKAKNREGKQVEMTLTISDGSRFSEGMTVAQIFETVDGAREVWGWTDFEYDGKFEEVDEEVESDEEYDQAIFDRYENFFDDED